MSDRWYVVLTEPMQAITAVWRLHELGVELFVPIVRRRVPSGRRNRAGQKLLRVAPRPMFPGYGFVRVAQCPDIGLVTDIRGVRDVVRFRADREPITLPDEAIQAVFEEQHARHVEFVFEKKRKRSPFKRGDAVRVNDAKSPYAGMIANIDRIDGNGRLQVLFGMIRHSLPADMVVAA